MAGTLAASFSASFTTSAGARVGLDSGSSTTFATSGSTAITNVQTIGTSEEAILVGDVGTLGWIGVRNLDPTNYVEVGTGATLTSANTFAHLLPGEWFFIKANASATYYAKANTGACNCQTIVVPA